MFRIASFGMCATFAMLMVACGEDSSSSPTNGGDDKMSSEGLSSSESSQDEVSSSSVIESSSSESSEPMTSFTDPRDQQTYKVVTIGKQVWMAQNLNYDMNSGFAYSVCYEEKEENCKKFGRLYNWTGAALGCPEGWHLPTNEDFDVLFATVGGIKKAGIKLKSATGWAEDYLNGTDDYGFSLLPAGQKTGSTPPFDGLGYVTQLWSATEHNDYIGYYVKIQYDEPLYHSFNKSDLRSVRCLKD